MNSEQWIAEQDEINRLLRKNDFSGVSLDMLNKIYTHLDVDIRYMQGQLERIEKAALLEEERRMEPAHTTAWRDENNRLKQDIADLEKRLKERDAA